MNYYTVYNRKTDEVVAHGTGKECASMLGIKVNSFYQRVFRAGRNQTTKYEILKEKYFDVVKEETL